MACREQGQVGSNHFSGLLNMDAQDAQDNQDATLLHERLTPAVIGCGFADV